MPKGMSKEELKQYEDVPTEGIVGALGTLFSSETPEWTNIPTKPEMPKLVPENMDWDDVQAWSLLGEKLGEVAAYPSRMTAELGNIQARGLQGLPVGSSTEILKSVPSSASADYLDLVASTQRKKRQAEDRTKLHKVLDKIVKGGNEDVPEYGGNEDLVSRNPASSNPLFDMGFIDSFLIPAISNEEAEEWNVPRKILQAILDKGNSARTRFDQPTKEEILVKRQVKERLGPVDKSSAVRETESLIGSGAPMDPSVKEPDLAEITDLWLDKELGRKPGAPLTPEELSKMSVETSKDSGELIGFGQKEQVQKSPSDTLTKIAGVMSLSDKLDFLDNKKDNKKVEELKKEIEALKAQKRNEGDIEWMKLQQEKIRDAKVTPVPIVPIRWS